MPPQEVIQSFMAKLTTHGLSYSESVGKNMLDAAIKASSSYEGIQDAIDAMKADQIAAEKIAVEEVLGSDYAGKTISEIDSSILNADAKIYDTNNIGNAYHNSANDKRTTVERLIKERKAIIFLEKYCGIQLNNNYWITSSDGVTYWNGDTTGNVDTGAITGSDANVTLKAGDIVNDVVLTPEIMELLAQKDGVSLSGDELIIGTGTEKKDRSIVPEIGNKYTASGTKAQNIKTGSNDWIVVATSGNDTITTGGADSISAGAGNDSIIVGADYASINTGAGNDTVEISAEVKNVTIKDLNSNDTIKISGTFEVGTAKIEDTMLVVTDTTGTRQIRLGDLTNAKSAKINSTTIADWLINVGIDLNNLPTSSGNAISESVEEMELGIVNKEDDGGQIEIEPDYTPSPVSVEPDKDTKGAPTRSSNSTGDINVNLDNVTLQSGDYKVDGNTVGTISNEFPNVNSYTKNGLTIYLVGTTSNTDGYPDNFTKKTFDELSDDQKTIVAGLFKWWAKESLQLNEESYGISFNSDTAMVKEIGLFFYDSNGSGNTLASVWNWHLGENTTDLMLNINMNYYSGIKADNFDGEGSGTSGFLDRTLAHEFTHAVMAANISYFNSLPKFIKEGTAELTHGIDDFRSTNIFKIAYDAEWLDASLDLDNTGTGSQSVGDGYSGGYMFLRYLAKQAALQTLFDGVDIPNDNPLYVRLTEDADTYENDTAGATILAFGGNDTITNIADNVKINGGDGNDEIVNVGENVTISGGAGDDYVENYGSEVIIDAGAGSDTILNVGSEVTIDGGTDDDIIFNLAQIDEQTGEVITSPDNVIINGGAGNDTIENDGSNASINDGDGDDYIYNNAVNVTINAGAGNDSIQNSGDNVLIKYAKGSGNDIINGFNETSTLDIGGNKYSTTKSGNNLIVNIINSGRITLANAATLSELNILGTFTEDTTPSSEILTLTNSSNAAVTLDSTKKYADASARTKAIKIVGNTKNNSLVGGAANDTLDGATCNDTLTGGSGKNLFVYSAGNDVITDYTTNDKISMASAYNNYAIDGSDVILGYGTNNSLRIEDALNKAITSVVGKTTKTNIYTEAGVFDSKRTAVTLASTAGDFDAGNYSALITIDGAATGKIEITGNAKANRIIAGAKGSTLNGKAGNDTLTGGNGADIFIYENKSGNDVITNYGASDKISLDVKISDASIKSGNSIFKIGKNTLTVKDSTNVTLATEEGTMVYSDGVFSDTAKTSATLPATFAKQFDMGNYKNADSTGRSGAIKITGNAKDNSIFGGKGNDTLDGATGSDTLTGGSGSDIFIYSNGNDFIADYETKDKISISGELVYANYAISGDNVVLNYSGNNSLTIANGKNKAITSVTGKKTNANIYTEAGVFNSNRTAATLASTAGDFNAVDYSALITIDGAAAGKIEITGNAKANRIIAGAKGSTLNGGKGNDTLWGGSSDDEFIYKANEGNDIIANYQSGDLLTILDKNGNEGGTFKKATFANNTLTLTINGGGTVALKNVSSSTAFNINNNTYHVSGKTII